MATTGMEATKIMKRSYHSGEMFDIKTNSPYQYYKECIKTSKENTLSC